MSTAMEVLQQQPISKISWEVNGHTTRCTSPICVVWQLHLVSGGGLMKRIRALPYRPTRRGKNFTFLLETPRQAKSFDFGPRLCTTPVHIHTQHYSQWTFSTDKSFPSFPLSHYCYRISQKETQTFGWAGLVAGHQHAGNVRSAAEDDTRCYLPFFLSRSDSRSSPRHRLTRTINSTG